MIPTKPKTIEQLRPGDRGAACTLFAPLMRQSHEVAMLAYLDPDWRLLGLRHTSDVCADAVALPIRTIVGDALVFDAAAVMMAHNHPSGDPQPSRADRELTRRLARVLDAIGVRLVDHLVLGDGAAVSFRALGLL